MDITQQNPPLAIYLCRAQHRDGRAYAEIAASVPATAARVLDAGCGPGMLVLKIAERASFVVGYDLSPAMIELAQKRQSELGLTNVAWVIANADAPPFADHSFDFIVSTVALRFTHLDQSLPAIRQLLRDGGRLVIRDLVLPPTKSFYLAHGAETLRLLPRLYRMYGFAGTWRLLIYLSSPAGLAQARKNRSVDTTAFEKIYRHYFPSCQINCQVAHQTVYWDKLSNDQETPIPKRK